MNATVLALHDAGRRRLPAFFAWTTVLLISDLPDILWHAVFGDIPTWIFWIKVGALALLLATCAVSKDVRPLWQFASVMLVFYLAIRASTWIGGAPWWKSRFNHVRSED